MDRDSFLYNPITQNFFKHLDKNKSSDLSLVLGTQLFLESLLNEFLENQYFAEPDYINKANLSFYQKVYVSGYQGMPSYLVNSMILINKIRNDFAHKLDTLITKKTINDFLILVPEPMKSMIKDMDEFKDTNSKNFTEQFFVIAVFIFTNVHIALNSKKEDKSKLHNMLDGVKERMKAKKA